MTKRDLGFEELEKYRFFPNKQLGAGDYRMLLSTKNKVIDSQMHAEMLLKVVESHIHTGAIDKRDPIFQFKDSNKKAFYLDSVQVDKMSESACDSLKTVVRMLRGTWIIYDFTTICGFGRYKMVKIVLNEYAQHVQRTQYDPFGRSLFGDEGAGCNYRFGML